MKCSFKYDTSADGRTFYMCRIMNQKILNNSELKLVGKHVNGKNDTDVQEIRFIGCSLDQIPQGLMNKFPFLEDLSIWKSDIKKINKNDLADYKTLKRLYILNSKIEFLPGDLFDGFQNLEEVSFAGNKMKIIEPTVLDGPRELKHVDFSQNANYDMIYSIYPDYNPNATLEEVKTKLHSVFENYKDLLPQMEMFTSVASAETQTDTAKRIRMIPCTPKESQKSISNCIKNYIQDERFKDFKVQIGDRVFPVHKFLLAARSSTLADVFLNKPDIKKLNLVDIPVDIFESILKYIYTDEFPPMEGLDTPQWSRNVKNVHNFNVRHFFV